MEVHLPDAFQAETEDPFRFFVSAEDQEILSVFNDMGEIVIGCIAPVTNIDSQTAVVCGINHLAECAVFIAFPARLDDKVSEVSVKNGVTGVYVSQIIALGGF